MPENLGTLAYQRYCLLVKQLADEYKASSGKSYGWKAYVARKLGVKSSYIGMLIDKQRVSVGRRAMERATERMHLRPDFFFSKTIGDVHYRDFLLHHPRDPLSDPEFRAIWEEFIHSEATRTITFEEMDVLLRFDWGGRKPTIISFAMLLSALRYAQPPDPQAFEQDAESGEDDEEEADTKRSSSPPADTTDSFVVGES